MFWIWWWLVAVHNLTCCMKHCGCYLWNGMSNLSNFPSVASTHDKHVFSFYPDHRPCHGFEEVLTRYREIVPLLTLSGFGQFPFPIIYAISFWKLLATWSFSFAEYLCNCKKDFSILYCCFPFISLSVIQ